jgi:hypothetical protein
VSEQSESYGDRAQSPRVRFAVEDYEPDRVVPVVVEKRNSVPNDVVVADSSASDLVAEATQLGGTSEGRIEVVEAIVARPLVSLDQSQSRNGDDEWETHQVEANDLAHVSHDSSDRNVGGDNNDNNKNGGAESSPKQTTSFNNIEYHVENGKPKTSSTNLESISSHGAFPQINTNSSISTTVNTNDPIRIETNNQPTTATTVSSQLPVTLTLPMPSPPSKPTPLYYDYAVQRQNWYWAMNERVLRFTPDHIQRLEANVVREAHFYREIMRIEVSNVDRTKFIIWYEGLLFCVVVVDDDDVVVVVVFFFEEDECGRCI